MAYRSDVRIAIPYDKFNLLINEIDKQVELYNNTIEDYNKEQTNPYLKRYPIENILRNANIYTDKEYYYIAKLEWVKFDQDYKDCKILIDALDKICEEEYNIIQMGEDGAVIMDYNANEDLPYFTTITEIITECNDEDKEIKIDIP